VRGVVASLVALLLGAALLALSGASAGVHARTVLDLGDSLSVGTAPYLRERLDGYRVAPIHDVGLHAYDAAAIVAKRRASLPAVVVVSAGTNDDPRIVSTFWRSARRVVTAAGTRRCVVWPTIVRPDAVGASYEGLNGALARVAARHRNLVLVDWVAMVQRNPSWLSPDGVHVSAEGYRARAAAIAAAVRARCPARIP
jgi:lysophospholipase L1-like esterase